MTARKTTKKVKRTRAQPKEQELTFRIRDWQKAAKLSSFLPDISCTPHSPSESPTGRCFEWIQDAKSADPFGDAPALVKDVAGFSRSLAVELFDTDATESHVLQLTEIILKEMRNNKGAKFNVDMHRET